ncbi:hypothetical protein L9F63_004937, partial [Diploptera punctata]
EFFAASMLPLPCCFRSARTRLVYIILSIKSSQILHLLADYFCSVYFCSGIFPPTNAVFQLTFNTSTVHTYYFSRNISLRNDGIAVTRDMLQL